ncbi:MAG: hypothetical protein KDB27_14930 [Planctomycetales bacterium]|nr:hypothetical protein [Planctomycetales bacterium]
MTLKKSHLMTVIASLLICGGVNANDIHPDSEFVNAGPAANPVVIDGNLSEWSGGNAVVNPQFSIPKGSGNAGSYVIFESNGADWTGTDDQSSNLQISYDSDNVYIGLVVTDEYHENAANSAWNGDTVQMMVANGARDAQVGLYNYALGGIDGGLGSVIVNHEAGPGGTEAVVTRDAGALQTTYEIKLPKAALGLSELTVGTQFGLGMAINDGDQAIPGQGGWGGLGAHAIVFGKSPGETALVTLVPEPAGVGLAAVGAFAALMLRRRR